MAGWRTVFSALDTVLDRKVAIKLLQQRRRRDGRAARAVRTVRARAEGKIVHPNVVSVHDVGETEDGRPYIVMDTSRGSPLAELVDGTPLFVGTRPRRSGWGSPRARGRRTSWEFFHRDVKPANVIIDRQGIPHLMDFGPGPRVVGRRRRRYRTWSCSSARPTTFAPEQARYGTAVPPRTYMRSVRCSTTR